MKTPVWEPSAGALVAWLLANTQARPLDLWTIKLSNGTTLRWTSGDVIVTVNGATWGLGPGITRTRTDDHLLAGMPAGTDFYFVHSYAFAPEDPSDVLATTDYGVPVTAAVWRGHVWGTQFHPEKSQENGLRLVKNFIAYEGACCACH